MPHGRDAAKFPPSRRSGFKRRVLAIGLAICAPALAVPAAAQAAGEAERLEEMGVTRIIVKRESGLTRAERGDLRRDAGVRLVRRLALEDTELVRARRGDLAEAVAELESDPDVVYAEPDAPLRAAGPDPLWSDLWALENVGQVVNGVQGVADADIDAPEAWAVSTGAGATVAVVDSGADFAQPDLAGALAVNPGESGDGRETNGVDDDDNGFVDDFRGWDWVERDNQPADGNGHGTHVTALIAGRRDNDIGGAGVAPSASVMPLRVLDDRGAGFSSAAAEALDYAGREGFRIVNASLGGAVYVKALEDAIAAHPDTLYVLAAGNGAQDPATGRVAGFDLDATPFYPCALPQDNVICVGASDSSDQPAVFSNFGARAVDLHAPGAGIRSAYRDGYAFMSGTSMATPFVAGTAALISAAQPELDVEEIRDRLLATSEARPGLAGRSATGGRLNAGAALALSAPPEGDPAAAGPAVVSGLSLSGETLRRTLRVSFASDRTGPLRMTVRQRFCFGDACRHVTRRVTEMTGRAGANRVRLDRTDAGRRLPAGTYLLEVGSALGGGGEPPSAPFTVR